ncbi:SseB family protein [Actinorugispora endophytica]|uniref:Type III secretion system (T3SS) SseB-like protein n=1 Tax=Actinorugispora endophytica TaxID=1605990 RepID=A0A4R6ULE1_9ACTN|nr:SseB family protein [Actinorugispora endophytica]TDQ45955.1 type III secretion system (T3SS) SseB-like protein [Actinorugispora endophytica]
MTTPTGPAGADSVPFPVNPVEEALAAAVEQSVPPPSADVDGDDDDEAGMESVSAFIGTLKEGSLWVPLPEGAGTQDDGSVALPTLDVDGSPFVPVFTSQEQLSVRSSDLPFTVVRTRELVDALPRGVGLAVNPGNPVSVPIYPETVLALASE